MTFKMLMQISLRSLRHHKGRTFLTMLGIIIGVGAVIATMAIGAGAQKKLQEKVASLGENFVVIQAGNRIQQGKIQGKSRKSKPLKENDIEVIEKQCENIRRASPVIYGSGTLEANGVTIKCECKSGNSNFIKMLGRKIILGSNLTPEHIKNKRRVVVIGYKAATELFKGANPIGKYIKHRGKSFLVIGVMQHIENYFNSIDPDFDCIFPITTARRYIMDNPWGQYIHSINIEAQDQEKMPALIRQARRILRALHHLKEKDSDDFTIWDQDSIAKAAKESSGIMRLLLLIVASISLLVGGVGIMNIMLVSVSERTKEIGIRMALGAKSSMLLRQFLIESIVICFIGGIVGIIVGGVVPFITAYFTGWQIILSIKSIPVAFGLTTIVGVFFGLYPAHIASKMNPVDALQEH